MLYEVVFKFNPYHGKHGRFASRNDATFISTTPKFAKTIARLKDTKDQDPSAKWVTGLTPEQNQAFDSWWQGTDNHREFNAWVRSDSAGKDSVPRAKRYAEAQKQIDSALSSAKLDKDRTLYRATALPGVTTKNAAEMVGAKITDHGFMATTSDATYASKFSQIKPKDAFMLEISAKKGTKGVANLGARRPKLGESEFLFARGATMRVKSYDKKTKTFKVEIEP